METAVESIQSLPGVSCAFFYDPGIGIASRQSDPGFSEENLANVGQIVEKFFSWGTELFSDVEQIRLRYDQSTVLVVKPAGNPFLVIIHDASLDADLLDMTVTQAMDNPAMSFDAPPSATASPDAGVSPKSDGAPKHQKLQKLLSSEPAANLMSALEKALNKVMGPMAAIIFSDARDRWIAGVDQLNKASVEKLVQMLCSEIGDEEKIGVFKQSIASHIDQL